MAQLQGIGESRIDGSVDFADADTRSVRLFEDPGLKIRLGETIRLGFPQSRFRPTPRQIRLFPPLVPKIAPDQLLNARKLALVRGPIPQDFGSAGGEEHQPPPAPHEEKQN